MEAPASLSKRMTASCSSGEPADAYKCSRRMSPQKEKNSRTLASVELPERPQTLTRLLLPEETEPKGDVGRVGEAGIPLK